MGMPESVVKVSLRSAEAVDDLDLESDIFALDFPRFAERDYGENYKHSSNTNGCGDQPVRNVASPGTERGIEPGESHDSKKSPRNFVEKLFERAPETLKPALFSC